MKSFVLFINTIVVIIILSSCNFLAEGYFEPKIKKNVYLEEENFGGLGEKEARAKIESLAVKLNTHSSNAIFDEKTWEIAKKEEEGRRIDIEKTLDNLMSLEKGESASITYQYLKPEITDSMLLENIDVIGSSQTPILDNKSARINNIKIAMGTIHNMILWPGQEFSFNDIVGERTVEKGYKEAVILMRTKDGVKKIMGVGGGVCQLSTTIYNTAHTSGLEIIERHSHSKDVGYAQQGKDAAVDYGGYDLKFRNNMKNPVMIKTYLDNDILSVEFLLNKNL